MTKFYKKVLLLFSLIRLALNLRGRFHYDVIFYADGIVDEPWMRLIAKSLENSRLKVLVIIIDDWDETVSKNYKKKEIVFLKHKRLLKFFKFHALLTPTSCIDRKIFSSSVQKIVYIPHSLASLHMVYPESFTDPFNVIFAAGPHQAEEFKIIKTHKKQSYEVYEIGYPKFELFDQMSAKDSCKRNVLFAPSWGQYNLEEIFTMDFFRKIQSNQYSFFFRPHPLLKIKNAKYLHDLKKEFPTLVDESSESLYSLSDADVLISDFSGISMEYIALTKKPVIFINLPKKMVNPNYALYGIEPMELRVRMMLPNIFLENIDYNEIKSAVNFLLNQDLSHTYKSIKQFLYSPSETSATRATQIIESWFKI